MTSILAGPCSATPDDAPSRRSDPGYQAFWLLQVTS